MHTLEVSKNLSIIANKSYRSHLAHDRPNQKVYKHSDQPAPEAPRKSALEEVYR